MKNKSYSESETDLLTASTDTLATKKDFPMEVRHDVRRFSKFVWNPENEEIVGKTDVTWARLLLFYFCFMSVLAAYTAVSLSIYLEVCISFCEPHNLTVDLILSVSQMPTFRLFFEVTLAVTQLCVHSNTVLAILQRLWNISLAPRGSSGYKVCTRVANINFRTY